ncbi:MAG: hypothetical protein AAGF26_17565, partial [Cyanobacteria bacterium P01_G01_bin.49]
VSQTLKIGEILSLRGWVKPQTADFFAENWPSLVNEPNRHPIGQYFYQASLLNEAQIESILSQQKSGQTWIRFGALAVLLGYLKQETVDLFVKYLAPPPSSQQFVAVSKTRTGQEEETEEEEEIRWIG